ncbi:chromatin modification-related protein EAF1 B-like isoform X2 [Mercurialis annua]|uniref:chromatin modification-related protein EAF1 B-like isoform X2 n=1 Tax=Mercurialis annua TaxID=3986 RepID=UPI00215E9787|nr:chromatin modification-related protein EAF1 B-like isoform X2 [Mercurialis annua]
MHVCGLGSALLVNAEVDSMGGVVDGGVGIGIKTSPRRAAIERAQTELRQEYDVREERRRELEFLEKGGNPLDFKFGNAASVSVQSTSLTDHQTENFVTSEAKGSFALTASPHGDSVESSGRPGALTVCEPNSADNFDADNEILERERKFKHSSRRSHVAPSEQSSQIDGAQNAKESEDSAIVRPYARRNRSRPNRDGARSSSTDVVQSSGGHGSLLQIHGGSRDAKGSISETNHEKDRIITSGLHPKSTASNGDMVSQILVTNSQSKKHVDGAQALEALASTTKSSLPESRLNVPDANISGGNQHDKTGVLEDDQKMSVDMVSRGCDHVEGKEQVILAASEYPCGAAVTKTENENGSAHLNIFNDLKKDGIEGQNNNGAQGTKGLHSESSCTQNVMCLEANKESDLHIIGRNDDTNEILVKRTSDSEEMEILVAGEIGNEKNDIKVIDCGDVMKEDDIFPHQNQSDNDPVRNIKEEIQKSPDELKCSSYSKEVEQNDHTEPEGDKKQCNEIGENFSVNIFSGVPQNSINFSNKELSELTLSEKSSYAAADPQSCSGNHLVAAEKAHEDSILEEARSIEAKRKRIAELHVGTVPLESRRKCNWDFVLEEMAWLANDFAQERLWKMTAAAQICHRVAFSYQLRVEEQNQQRKLKRVAYSLSKAVMQFWHSAEVLVNGDDQFAGLKNSKHDSRIFDGKELSKDKLGELDKETYTDFEMQSPGKNFARSIQGYAVRFLRCNNSPIPSLEAEAPATPDRLGDSGIVETSWEDHLTEESLFYAVPSGAMEAYRISIESHLAQCEKTGSNIQEEVDTSMYDATADFGYRGDMYDEEDGETNTYYLHGGLDNTKSTKHDQKKRKILKYSADFPYGNYAAGSQPHALMGKRPGSASNLHVGPIPTKRVRTTPRPRFITPFTAGASGCMQTPAKTDASSGDTSSFQDEQSTLHGGSQVQKSVEVESVAEQLTYDCAETSTKPKKKKKAKHLASAYEGWQMDSTFHNEQRDNSKRRLDSPHFDSNGTSGLYGYHTSKKPKLLKRSLDNTYDNMAQSGLVPSPAASQMSNMPCTNKGVKMIGNRDRGRKTKLLKVPTGPQGPGSPWSLFEDQALVVLVHDMGPNWELVSDAINSTLQFKCIFRKPKECKERHKILMDKSGGDDYDSADDSRTSQSYPSTLPGIPKGSARQLFQRLQEPMEEDTIKSHFEKITLIGKKYHYRRNQNDNQDPKQIVAVHNSHAATLDQVPTNQNGGVLTPLDLCDASAASPDIIPIVSQNSHATGIPLANQAAVGSVLPTSGVNTSLSSGVALGNNSSSSGQLNVPIRDGRYNVPRTSLPADEQQRMQHYGQMLSNRNLQQPNLSVSGADRGVRMPPGGNPMGMMHGMSRSLPQPRPGFQGMASSSVLNSGSMLSAGVVGMPSLVNMQSASGSGQRNSMMRSREGVHMMRANHNSEHQRQVMAPELQMQVTQTNSQGIPAFNGLSSTPPSVHAYPGHAPQQHQMPPQQSHVMKHPQIQGTNHTTGSQQQAYAMRIAKERMQHRLLQQQPQQNQQQFAASGALISHVQPPSQLPISSSMQNSSHIQPQTSQQPVSLPTLSSPSSMTPMSVQPQQQKHTLPHHGISANSQTAASGLTNQMGKQRPRQPQQNQQFQQSGRIHPSQRQHAQSTQQAKLLKGMGRGNMTVHQNLPIDHAPLNGFSVPTGNQSADKGEHIMHLMQSQGLYPGSGLSSIPSSKPLATQSSNHSQPQQKLFSASAPPSSKQLQQVPSHADPSTQGQVPSVSSGHSLSTAHQTLPASIMASNHQHLQPQPQIQQKQASQAQPTVQRMVQQNRQLNSELPTKSQIDQGHIEQQPFCNVPQMGATTNTSVSQSSNDSANVVPVVSSSVASQWKPSEPSCDSALTNSASQGGSIACPPLTNSAGSEPIASVNQGLGQRQLSGGLAQHKGAGSQRQQHLPPLQSSPPPLQPVSQQLFQPQEQQLQPEEQSSRQQLPLQQHSQQHTQHPQSAQGSLYMRPTNSHME